MDNKVATHSTDKVYDIIEQKQNDDIEQQASDVMTSKKEQVDKQVTDNTITNPMTNENPNHVDILVNNSVKQETETCVEKANNANQI